MIIGPALGDFTVSGFDLADSLSVTDPLTVIAQTLPPPRLSFVVIAKPYDHDAGAITTLTTANDLGPGNQSYVEPNIHRVIRPYNFEVRLPGITVTDRGTEESGFLPGGTAVPAGGAIAWRNEDRSIDDWTAYDWTDREIETYVGIEGADWPDEYAKIFSGRTDRAAWTWSEFKAYVRDQRRRLQKPIQPTLYAGTGGLEGGDEIKGQPKPLAYGQLRQVEPVLVDGTNHVYQVHDGSIQAVQAVRDKGSALTFDQDVADITAVTPAPGEYATSLANGYIKLGEGPEGALTADLQGDNSGPLGYVSDAANILRAIAVDRGGLTDPDDLELGAFADLESDVTYTIGYYTRSESQDVAHVLDRVAGGVHGYWVVNRLGRMVVGRIPADPSTSPVDSEIPNGFQFVEIDEQGYGQIERERASAASYRVRLPYRRHWKVLDADAVAAAVGEDTRQDYGQEWRWSSDEDASVQTAVPGALDLELDWSLIDTSTDASTEVSRLLTLFSSERGFWRIAVYNPAFQYQVGQIVKLTASALGLDSGKRLVVAGVREDPSQDRAKATLTLWG